MVNKIVQVSEQNIRILWTVTYR